jgi:hypothetical protein
MRIHHRQAARSVYEMDFFTDKVQSIERSAKQDRIELVLELLAKITDCQASLTAAKGKV